MAELLAAALDDLGDSSDFDPFSLVLEIVVRKIKVTVDSDY